MGICNMHMFGRPAIVVFSLTILSVLFFDFISNGCKPKWCKNAIQTILLYIFWTDNEYNWNDQEQILNELQNDKPVQIEANTQNANRNTSRKHTNKTTTSISSI